MEHEKNFERNCNGHQAIPQETRKSHGNIFKCSHNGWVKTSSDILKTTDTLGLTLFQTFLKSHAPHLFSEAARSMKPRDAKIFQI